MKRQVHFLFGGRMKVVAQNYILPYRGFVICWLSLVGGFAEWNSAIQQIENLRYSECRPL